jgi:hypothetical protein
MSTPLDVLNRKAAILNHFKEATIVSETKIEKPENPDHFIKKVGTAVLSVLPAPEEKESTETIDNPAETVPEPSAFLDGENSYIIDSRKYFYLQDNKQLQNDTEAVIGGKPRSWTIYFCIFQVNDTCKEPFLEYLLEKNPSTGKYHFPSITLETIKGESNETLFQTKCDERIISQASLDDTDSLRTHYRGFLENEDKNTGSKEDCLYVFYDMTHVEFRRTENQQWAIMDELINERKVLGTEIDLAVFTLFYSHPHLISLVNERGDRVSLPICLYLCEKIDQELEQGQSLGERDYEYRNVVRSGNDQMDSKSLVRDSVEHDIFGDVFIFSVYPLVENGSVKRFAVFVGEPLYILNKKTPLRKIASLQSDENREADGQVGHNVSIDDYMSMYFFENQTPLWCIRSGEQFTEI